MLAQEILKIPLTEPEKLFKTEDEIKIIYHSLAKEWHPDINKSNQAEEVLAHLNLLFDYGKQKIKDGKWEIPNKLHIKDINSKKEYRLKYVKKHTLPIGEMYISRTLVTFLVEKSNKDLFDNFKRVLLFKFANDKMKSEIEKYLTSTFFEAETSDKYVIGLRKEADMILAKDLLEYFDNYMPPKHVCWIMSSIYNLLAYLQFANICHGDISLNSYFISPQNHAGALIGGWFYSQNFSDKLVALPTRTLNVVPRKIIEGKKPCAKIDLESARAFGRELFNDPSGMKIIKNDEVPKELATWFRFPAGSNGIDEYKSWVTTLETAYGKRRFTEMTVKFEDVYSD